jgi:hypothetical protein
MTEEKLKRCNELANQIDTTKRQIKDAQFTQSINVPEREMYIKVLGLDNKIIAPESLFRIIGKLIINEHQQKLIELETEFNNL